jgi:hypothetical protein
VDELSGVGINGKTKKKEKKRWIVGKGYSLVNGLISIEGSRWYLNKTFVPII